MARADLDTVHITCVIVAFESDALLETLVVSLTQQKDVSLRIVVVDNAASPSTQELVRGMRGQISSALDVEYMALAHNPGYAAAVNAGVSRARTGDYVLVSNPDVTFPEGALGRLVKELKEDASMGVLAPRLMDPTGKEYLVDTRFPSWASLLGSLLHLHHLKLGRLSARYRVPVIDGPIEVDWVSGAVMLLPPANGKSRQTMDERFFMYMEDVDLCRTLRERGFRVGLSGSVFVFHVGGASSQGSAARGYVQTRLARLLYADKWLTRRDFDAMKLLFTIEALLKMSLGITVRRGAVGGPRRWLRIAGCVTPTSVRDWQFDPLVVRRK